MCRPGCVNAVKGLARHRIASRMGGRGHRSSSFYSAHPSIAQSPLYGRPGLDLGGSMAYAVGWPAMARDWVP
jgi:hypothetical protein